MKKRNSKQSTDRSLKAKNRLALSMRPFTMKRLGVSMKCLRFLLAIKRSRNKKKQQADTLIYLDGSFLFHCFVHNMDIRNIKLMFDSRNLALGTTDCTWKELKWYMKSFSDHDILTVYSSMKAEISMIKCRHKDQMRAKDCILNLIGGKNENKAFVATQDGSFLHELAKNPLIAVVVVEGGGFKCLPKINSVMEVHHPHLLDQPEDQDDVRLMARMKFYEYKRIKVKGNGNCAFMALAEQTTHCRGNHGKLQYHEELYEEEVKKYMDLHPKIFGEQHTYSDFVVYFSRKRNLVPLAITLQAASDLFEAKVVCLSSNEEEVFLEFIPHDVDDPVTVLYLSLLTRQIGHADSMYPKRTPSTSCLHLYDLDMLLRVTEKDSF